MGECDVCYSLSQVRDETRRGSNGIGGYLGRGCGKLDVEEEEDCSKRVNMPPGSPRRAVPVSNGMAGGSGGVGRCRYVAKTMMKGDVVVEKSTVEEGDIVSVSGGKKKIGSGEGLGLSKRSRKIERRARREKGMDMLVDLVKKVVLLEKEGEQKADVVKGRGAIAMFGDWKVKEEEATKEDEADGKKEEGDVEELRFLIEKCEIGKKKEAVEMFMPYIT